MKHSQAALPMRSDPQLKSEPWAGFSRRRGRPIDLVHLTRQTIGDKRLESELLRLFMRQSEQIRRSLETASEAERPAISSLELMHMLSGSARAIGATDVASLAGGIEADMRRGEKTDLDPAERQSLCGLLAETNDFIVELLDQG